MALDVASGMAHIIRNHIFHRDLKGDNVLVFEVDEIPVCKLADFGLSVEDVSDIETGRVGTAQFTAPEVLLSMPYTEKSDVYSFAVLLWSMITRSIPYRGL